MHILSGNDPPSKKKERKKKIKCKGTSFFFLKNRQLRYFLIPCPLLSWEEGGGGGRRRGLGVTLWEITLTLDLRPRLK